MVTRRHCAEADYLRLRDIWETSVRATHGFLSESDIMEIRDKLIPEYFPNVMLSCAEVDGTIAGFIGLSGDKIEMLFVDADFMCQGIGTFLIGEAIKEGAMLVDVNEQNPKALEFYKNKGFVEIGRSATDEAGRPFPVLHLALSRRHCLRQIIS